MKIFIYLLVILSLEGCLFLDLMPSYSSYWDENIWVHKDTKKPLTKDTHMACFNQSIQGLEIKDVSGFPEVVGVKDREESNKRYAMCLRDKGFVFNASYAYCYKFKDVCDAYNKYRK